MSTIVANALADRNKTASKPMDAAFSGAVGSYLAYRNNGVATTLDSYNTSSIIDSAVGSFRPTFTNAFANGNYITNGWGVETETESPPEGWVAVVPRLDGAGAFANKSTTTVRLDSSNANTDAVVDSYYVVCTVTGDLA